MFGKDYDDDDDDMSYMHILSRFDEPEEDDTDKKILKQLVENGKTLDRIAKSLKRIEGRIG